MYCWFSNVFKTIKIATIRKERNRKKTISRRRNPYSVRTGGKGQNRLVCCFYLALIEITVGTKYQLAKHVPLYCPPWFVISVNDIFYNVVQCGARIKKTRRLSTSRHLSSWSATPKRPTTLRARTPTKFPARFTTTTRKAQLRTSRAGILPRQPSKRAKETLTSTALNPDSFQPSSSLSRISLRTRLCPLCLRTANPAATPRCHL